VEHFDEILDMLGDTAPKKYLIVLQNSDEIRPTGGFMGSVALVTLEHGNIQHFEQKDIYALEWELKQLAKDRIAFREPAPAGLSKITPTFGLRDANYFPSVEESSRKILEFLEPLGYQFDGIWYVNQNVVSDILATTGGVFFEDIQMRIDGENFSTVFSLLVESKRYQTDEADSTPKQILFDFIPVFLEHIAEYPDKKALVRTLQQIFTKKDVFFWSSDEKKMQLAKDFSLFFDATPETLDFVYPVFTSISGNKSDRYMQRTFAKDYEIFGNCDIRTTFQLSQKHVFPIETQTRIQSLAYTFQALGKHSLDEMLFIAGK